MKRVIPLLVSKGMDVTDLTERCWMTSAKNNLVLSSALAGVETTADTAFVLDLFGNSTARYRTLDDSTSPATFMGKGRGWHMLGDVTWATDKELGGQVDGLKGVFTTIADFNKVILPPIPRYLFGGCCTDTEHTSNTYTEGHAATAICEHTRMRNTIKQKLISNGTKHMRIVDVTGIYGSLHSTSQEKANALKHFTSQDNVHLTPAGYNKLADSIIEAITTLHLQKSESIRKQQSQMHPPKSWKGFQTAVGTGSTASTPSSGRGGNRRHHPYKR